MSARRLSAEGGKADGSDCGECKSRLFGNSHWQVRRWGLTLPRTTRLLWCLVVAIIVAWAVLVLIGATTTS